MAPLLYACILFLPFTVGLIKFDCHGLNVTTLSLLDIGDYELAEVETSIEEIYVQLLQLSDYDRTKVQSGSWSHPLLWHALISAVQNGRRIYLQTLSITAC